MSKRFKRCALHIGTEKTGTKMIQRLLARNRSAFAKEGVVYARSTGEHGGSQWGFVACAQNEPWTSDMNEGLGIRSLADQIAYRHALTKSLRKEFRRRAKADVLVISSEHCHSRLTTIDEIARLKGFLETWVDSFEVVMYLRRQDRVSVSHYSTKLKVGHTEPDVLSYRPYYYDYDQIYDHWSSVFGTTSVRVRLFERAELTGGDLLEDFCSICQLNIAGKEIPSPANQSLNQAGVDFLLEVNRQLPYIVDGERNKARNQLALFIAKQCRGKSALCSRDQAIAFYERFREGNERLRKKAFPDRNAPLFAEEFGDYPERLEKAEPKYSDAVRLAISIWNAKKQ